MLERNAGRPLLLLLVAAAIAQAQQVSGRVFDGITHEPLARVKVAAGEAQTSTGGDGSFTLGVGAGSHTLQVSTVGYRPVREPFALAADESKVFEVALFPDTLRREESISVSAGPFVEPTPSSLSISGIELKNLASVMADDPMRSVQGLPGVTSSNDFQSQIALRGAGFERIGMYLDGILLHTPFHTLQGESSSASLTIFNGDMLESVELHAGAPEPRFSDRTVGVVEILGRDGDRQRFTARGTASASNLAGLFEGPLGKSRRGSWLVAARKSYLQYIINRVTDDPTLAFGFSDVQGRLSYDLTPRHGVSLSAVEGFSGLDREEAAPRLGVNSVITSDYKYTLARLGSRHALANTFLLNNRFAWMRERYLNWNRDKSPLNSGAYGEWVWNADAAKSWAENASLDFGVTVRRLRDDGYTNRYALPSQVQQLDSFRGSGIRAGLYAQQSASLFSGRLRLSGGLRWDRHSTNTISAVSPYASMAFQPWRNGRFALSFGQYVQYPEIADFHSRGGRTSLLTERASHHEFTFEQRLGERTRIRLELYNRQDRDLLFRPYGEPRIAVNGSVFVPRPVAAIENSQRGYARGLTAFVQRRTANGFTGWISYTYGIAKLYDGVLLQWSPADYWQRHAVNFFGSYRLRPTVNLSSRILYGAGLVVPGFFRRQSGTYFLAQDRNQVHLPDYFRADFRINKSWTWQRWHLILFGEVVNITNHDNLRYEELRSYNVRTGQASLSIQKMMPIVPSAGVVWEF
jgi:hypothetical protein